MNKALGSLILFVISLAILPLTALTFAQNNSSSSSTTSTQSSSAPAQSGSSQSSRETRTTTTTTASNPVEVTHTAAQRTGVDPIWFVVGAIALLAILVIAILSMRGRSHDRVATVREHTTVVRKE